MKPFVPRAARNYLAELSEALDFLTSDEREQILKQTRAQILQLPNKGKRADQLREQLGTPQHVAARFTRMVPQELSVTSGHRALARILAWPIFGFALLTALAMIVHPSSMKMLPEPVFEFMPAGIFRWLTELESVIGSGIMIIFLWPVLFALLPLAFAQRWVIIVQVVGALGATGLCLAEFNGIGLFFIPVTALLWAQVFTPVLMRRGSMGSPGPGLLIIAVVLLTIVLAYATYRGIVEFSGPVWMILAPVIFVEIIAVLLPWRFGWVPIALMCSAVVLWCGGVYASVEATYSSAFIWPWLAGGVVFSVGHLALAAQMWHRRAVNLLALI